MVLALHLSAFVACALLAVHVARVRASPSRGWFLLFVLAVTWWAACATLAGIATTSTWFLRWSQLSFVGIVAVPVLWLAFVDAFSHLEGARRRRVMVLSLLPACTLLLALVDPSAMVVAGVRREATALGTHFELLRGPWYWFVHLPYTYALLLVGVGRMVAFSRSSTRRVRQQVAVVVTAIVVPLAINVGERLGIVAAGPLELTVVAFTAAAVLMGWALLGRRFLELAPASYREALRGAGCVLVVDARGRIVDANRAAAELLDLERADDPVPLGRVLPSAAAALRRAPATPSTALVFTPNLPSRHTRISILPLTARHADAPDGHVLSFVVPDGSGADAVDAPPEAPPAAGGA